MTPPMGPASSARPPLGPDDGWDAAFEVAAGRRVAGSPRPPGPYAFANRMCVYGRAIVEEGPCPSRLLRRAEALFHPRRRPLVALWALLFDSSAGLSASTRGAPAARLLRYGGEGGAVQLEIARHAKGSARVAGALEGAPADARVVLTPSKGSVVRVATAEGGTFEASLPRGATSFRLEVRVGRRVVARTPDVAVPRR